MAIESDIKSVVEMTDFRFIPANKMIVIHLVRKFIQDKEVLSSIDLGDQVIDGDNFIEFMTANAQIYQAVKAATYNYLIAKNVVAGEVV